MICISSLRIYFFVLFWLTVFSNDNFLTAYCTIYIKFRQNHLYLLWLMHRYWITCDSCRRPKLSNKRYIVLLTQWNLPVDSKTTNWDLDSCLRPMAQFTQGMIPLVCCRNWHLNSQYIEQLTINHSCISKLQGSTTNLWHFHYIHFAVYISINKCIFHMH